MSDKALFPTPLLRRCPNPQFEATKATPLFPLPDKSMLHDHLRGLGTFPPQKASNTNLLATYTKVSSRTAPALDDRHPISNECHKTRPTGLHYWSSRMRSSHGPQRYS